MHKMETTKEEMENDISMKIGRRPAMQASRSERR